MNTTNSFTHSRFVLLLGAAAVLLVGSLLLVGTGAHAQTATSTPPVISATIVTPSDTGATVTWSTDQPSDTQVLYGETTSYDGSTTLDTTDVTAHTAFLGSLTPDTLYHFEVLSGNASGTVATSNDMTFMTTNTGATGTTTASTTEPVLSSITATPTANGATITWNTDENANSEIMYGTTASYGNTTALDSTQMMSHSETISGLAADTTYHFAVQSTDASNNTATSADMTFTTAMASTTGSSGTEPVLSDVLVSPTDTGATITWNSDESASSQVMYGTTASYGNTTPLDSTPVTTHTVVLSGLAPGTTYHFQVWSTDASHNTMGSTDLTFTTTNTGGSGTGTGSMTIDQLQAEITALQTQVASLENTVAGLTGGTSSTAPTGTPTIDQNGSTVSAGGTIDLSGRNFGHEETVTVSLNGNTVATAHADGGGNFSTGSIAGPATAGTYTYQFTGSSGDTATATIIVQ